jgi:hypothetical protein
MSFRDVQNSRPVFMPGLNTLSTANSDAVTVSVDVPSAASPLVTLVDSVPSKFTWSYILPMCFQGSAAPSAPVKGASTPGSRVPRSSMIPDALDLDGSGGGAQPGLILVTLILEVVTFLTKPFPLLVCLTDHPYAPYRDDHSKYLEILEADMS